MKLGVALLLRRPVSDPPKLALLINASFMYVRLPFKPGWELRNKNFTNHRPAISFAIEFQPRNRALDAQ
jgi:hypothetical protein